MKEMDSNLVRIEMDFGNGLENNFHHSKILYTQNFYDILLHVNGLIAQLVEQLTLNQLVVGSSPTEPIFIFYLRVF